MFPNLTLNGSDAVGWAIVIGLVLAVIWILQFAKLMSLDDTDLPGQFARFGWVAGFVTLWFIAPFAFIVWNRRRARAAMRHRARANDAA